MSYDPLAVTISMSDISPFSELLISELTSFRRAHDFKLHTIRKF